MPSNSYTTRRNPLKTATQILLVLVIYNATLIFITISANLVVRGEVHTASPASVWWYANARVGTKSGGKVVDAADVAVVGEEVQVDAKARPHASAGDDAAPAIAHDDEVNAKKADKGKTAEDTNVVKDTKDKKKEKAARPANTLPGEYDRRRSRERRGTTTAAAAAAEMKETVDAAVNAATAMGGSLRDGWNQAMESRSSLRTAAMFADIYDPHNTQLRSLIPGYRNAIAPLVASLFGGTLALALVVGRSRQVWDFTGTLFAFQLLLAVRFGRFWIPREPLWYGVQLTAALIMAVVGRKICLYLESRPVAFASSGVRGVLHDVLPNGGGSRPTSSTGSGGMRKDQDGVELHDVRKQLLRAMEEGRASGDVRREHDA